MHQQPIVTDKKNVHTDIKHFVNEFSVCRRLYFLVDCSFGSKREEESPKTVEVTSVGNPVAGTLFPFEGKSQSVLSVGASVNGCLDFNAGEDSLPFVLRFQCTMYSSVRHLPTSWRNIILSASFDQGRYLNAPMLVDFTLNNSIVNYHN